MKRRFAHGLNSINMKDHYKESEIKDQKKNKKFGHVTDSHSQSFNPTLSPSSITAAIHF